MNAKRPADPSTKSNQDGSLQKPEQATLKKLERLEERRQSGQETESWLPKEAAQNLRYMPSKRETNTLLESKFSSLRSRSKHVGPTTATVLDLKSKQSSVKQSTHSKRTKDYSIITSTGRHQSRQRERKADDIFSKGLTDKKVVNDQVAANNKLAGQLILSQGK